MEIEREKYTIRPWRPSDAPSLKQAADNIRLWRNLRDGFPHPYTEADAAAFIAMSAQADPVTNFAIEIDGAAAGGIGYVPHGDVERFSAEFGYWLAEPYWNRGIMTAVVGDFVEFVRTATDIVRLYAGIFAFNGASGRVLEKAGFRRVGTLEKAAFKNGRFVDKILYELVKIS
jgi:RimJ/RimL family protein N-acetyltransferase